MCAAEFVLYTLKAGFSASVSVVSLWIQSLPPRKEPSMMTRWQRPEGASSGAAGEGAYGHGHGLVRELITVVHQHVQLVAMPGVELG